MSNFIRQRKPGRRMQIATAETLYQTRSLDDGVTHIWEPHIQPFYRCNVWHVHGRDRDLLVDPAWASSACDASSASCPAAGSRPSPATPISTISAPITNSPIGPCTRPRPISWLSRPAAHLRRRLREGRYAGRDVHNASAGRLSLRRLPGEPGAGHPPARRRRHRRSRRPALRGDPPAGHSPGGIGLWEAATGTLFSGDTIYDGRWSTT